MSELKVGDIIRDNDPRTTRERRLEVIGLMGDLVSVRDQAPSFFTKPPVRTVQRKRIYTDDKPRRSGFSVVKA